MDLHRKNHERPLVKTKIIATVGPACAAPDQLKALVEAGVDLFRLNFAHGDHEWLGGIVASIRKVSHELDYPIGILGDLSGPKIRLGVLPEAGIVCNAGAQFEFVRESDSADSTKLTCTYPKLIDDLSVGDAVLLADGTVSMRVVDKPDADRVVCEVEQPGSIRSRQGINLPGVTLSTPSLTDKDRRDLAWALENEIDYVGLSFVRSSDDIRLLRSTIADLGAEHPPHIVAKIEKMEAVRDLDRILKATDAVMVARGDLGVEVDIALVPTLQKRIIRECNEHRIPVITATQMLDSMTSSQRPTRAEASDVANAVLDGSDAVMLSGETAIGSHPERVVAMMNRIVHEAEQFVASNPRGDRDSLPQSRATEVTEAITLGAGAAAKQFDADLIVIATHSGKTAMALSKQRRQIPILAFTDSGVTARRMCLYWGVTSLETDDVQGTPAKLIQHVIDWGKQRHILRTGSRLVLVTSTDWSNDGKDLMLVHTVE